MFGLTDKELGTYWKEGRLVWKLVDITVQAEEPYFHLRLVKGKHIFANNRVVYSSFFDDAVQVKRARVWRRVA